MKKNLFRDFIKERENRKLSYSNIEDISKYVKFPEDNEFKDAKYVDTDIDLPFGESIQMLKW